MGLDNICILGSRLCPTMATTVAERLGVPIALFPYLEANPEKEKSQFGDTEVNGLMPESMLAGKHVFIVMDTGPDVNLKLMHLLIMLRGCREYMAEKVTLVLTYMCYARQEKHDRRGSVIVAKLVADVIGTAGEGCLTDVITIDLHAQAIEGFFPVSCQQLSLVPLLIRRMGKLYGDRQDVGYTSPDLHGSNMAMLFVPSHEGAKLVPLGKVRMGEKTITVFDAPGINDRLGISVDDILATSGSNKTSNEFLVTQGMKGLVIVAVHAVCTGDIVKNLVEINPERLILTDTLERPASLDNLPTELAKRTEFVSAAPLIWEAIKARAAGKSLWDLKETSYWDRYFRQPFEMMGK